MSLAKAIKYLEYGYHFFFSPYNIDNRVFKLHYQAVVIFLFVFCPLFTNQYVEESYIECTNYGRSTDYTMNGYCFSIFTKKQNTPYEYDGEYMTDNRIWKIRAFLVVISIFSMIPHLLWMEFGGRDLKELYKMEGIHKGEFKPLLRRLARRMIFRQNNRWYCELLIAEIFNLLSVIGQWVLAYYFIDKRFFQIGPYVSFKQLELIFPSEFLCHYEMAGRSDIQLFSVCDLNIESWNQAALAFLYEWMVFIAFLTVMNLWYRAVLYLCKGKRWFCWHMGPAIRTDDLDWMVNVPTSDFVFLSYVCEDIGKESSVQLVSELRQELGLAALELCNDEETFEL